MEINPYAPTRLCIVSDQWETDSEQVDYKAIIRKSVHTLPNP